jgi:hypothetical protein
VPKRSKPTMIKRLSICAIALNYKQRKIINACPN